MNSLRNIYGRAHDRDRVLSFDKQTFISTLVSACLVFVLLSTALYSKCDEVDWLEKELEKSNCKDPKDCKEALTNIDKVYMDYLTSNLHAVMCGKNKLRVYRELKEPQFFFLFWICIIPMLLCIFGGETPGKFYNNNNNVFVVRQSHMQ